MELKEKPLMKIKRIAFTVVLLLSTASLSVFAQAYKVVEKSSKKAPVWYESAQSGYIVASAETTSMEESRRQCLESIKRQIIQSVAQNIEFSDSHVVKQTSGNGDRITEFVDQYLAEGSTRAASLPFIKGISLSKVEGSYWEKRRDKKSGKITYAYAIRYPFPESEHKALVRQFEEQDRQMEDLVKDMEENISRISSVEEIDRCITRMRPAVEYFFDKTRREWAEGVVQNYRKLPTFITAEGSATDKDAYTVSLFLNGTKITTATMPKLSSNCASQLKAVPRGEDILITYSSEDCLEDEENFVELTFRMPGKSLKHKFYFQLQ